MNLLQTAIEQHQFGNLLQAEIIYKQLLEINPQDTNVLHLYGILSAQKGDYDLAKQLLQKCLELEPNSATFHNSLGNVHWYLKNFPKAIEHFKIAIKLQPNSPSAHNNLGNLYAKQKQYVEAMEHYRQAIQLKKDFADAYYNLAIVEIKLGATKEAILHLREAIAIQPHFYEAHGQLAQLLQLENQLVAALVHYQEQLKSTHKDAETYVNMGAIAIKQGKFEEGVDYFKKAVEIDPSHHEAHFNLGSTYLNLKKLDQALLHYLQCIQLKKDPETYFNIGVIYTYQDRHQDAIDYFHSALQLLPDFFEAHVNLAATYLKMEKYTEAIGHYEAAQKLQPDNKEIRYILTALTEQASTLSAAPEEFVKSLFDQYAPHFEKHLMQYLHYQAHTLIYDNVKSTLKDKLNNLVIVDLGCGTGLCGALFKPHAKRLIGIDISSKMIEVAREKNIYDELITDDIVRALTSLREVDLIVAADVFGYLGDLALIFNAVTKSLKSGGFFAFTVEKSNDPTPYTLQKSTRFVHNKSYIDALCQEYHFTTLQTSEVTLRLQRQTPVIGLLYLCQLV